MIKPILYTEEQWRDSQLSIARHYGGITINDEEYEIVNKKGGPADLVMKKWIPYYKKIGRAHV